ncbi:hypothetical protein LOZ65_006294 [Ophidiomyces ophidiicola]|nr:hypothetical protein LOZ65_006294 [Ophidiomyces ophidiicola]
MSKLQPPPLAAIPPLNIREHIPRKEWVVYLNSWITSIEFRLRLSDAQFEMIASRDSQAKSFLSSYFNYSATSSGPGVNTLRRLCFLLGRRLLLSGCHTPELFLDWRFLGGFCTAFNSSAALPGLLGNVWQRTSKELTSKIESGKLDIIQFLSLEKGEVDASVLVDMQHLTLLALFVPEVGYLLMIGSDYIDAMVETYRCKKNELLQNAIVANMYVALSSLIALESPAISLFLDQLFNLMSNSDVITNVSEGLPTLLSDLLCNTALLKRTDTFFAERYSKRATDLLSSLISYQRRCCSIYTAPRPSRNRNKGKKRETETNETHEFHINKIPFVTRVLDLFPQLEPAFVSAVLDYYSGDTEVVILHLVEDSLPSHLKTNLLNQTPYSHDPPNIKPQLSPPSFTRKNIFDYDELDRLDICTDKLLHLGRAKANSNVDSMPADRSGHSANKAAIMSALAAFDFDEDERDDTYDIADVGGAIDAQISFDPETPRSLNSGINEEKECFLFKVYKSDPSLFNRDATTRRSPQRSSLRKDTSLTDEIIEAWATMLSRDPRRKARIERDYALSMGMFESNQHDLNQQGDDEKVLRDSNGEKRAVHGNWRNRNFGRQEDVSASSSHSLRHSVMAKDSKKRTYANYNRRIQRGKRITGE